MSGARAFDEAEFAVAADLAEHERQHASNGNEKTSTSTSPTGTIHSSDRDSEKKHMSGSDAEIRVASKAVSVRGGEASANPELVYPTEEEKSGPYALRRVSGKIEWSMYLIGIIEMAERFSYYGTTAVFVNFIQRPIPNNGRITGAVGGSDNLVPGALGLGTQASNGLTTFNTFWIYVIPLFGAYIADTRLGRFKTICWSVAIALVGHVLLIVSAVPSVMAHPNSAVAVFAIAIVIMGIGTGGFKANISPLIAEQSSATEQHVITTKKGERVIVDPALTTARIYNFFYLLINIGAIVGQIGMTYCERYVGFWLAYTLPTIFFLLCPIVLYVGWARKMYVQAPPQGSVLGTSMRIWRLCLSGTWSLDPRKAWQKWSAPDFWEKAKPKSVIARSNGVRPAWLTYDEVFVDEVSRGFKACAVFCFYPFYWIAYNQITNTLTSQAGTMQTHGVPNDVINNLDPFALLILIPICDYFVYPWLIRIGLPFTPLKRIFAGFMAGTAAMIWAAVVQYYIYERSPCGYYANGSDCAPAPLNVWIQTGSYVLIALSEIFASITGLEYAFTKAPKSMRSLVMAVFLFQNAFAAAINEAFNPLTADPHLIWNYVAAGILCFIAGIAFWICFRHLDGQEDELNAIGAHTNAVVNPAGEKQQH